MAQEVQKEKEEVYKVDPMVLSQVRKYGRFDIGACYTCGSCVIQCPLTSDSGSFPRRCIHYVQLGLKELLRGSLEPWLCYYCGDCSTTCPRQAEPGESMMTLRRYLTAQYDWTGLASRFYKSALWEIGALIVVGALVLLLAIFFHGPLVTERVELNTFAPVKLVHNFDMILLVTLSFFLLSNAFRMWWFTVIKSKIKIPIYLYITGIKTLLLHFVTQMRFKECANQLRWLKHILLVSGYVIMFTLVVVFLNWFQTDNFYPIYHPQRWVGYYAFVVLTIFSVEILIGRIKKIEQMHKFSELSDWIFPVLLLLTSVSGIAVHIFRYSGMPLATYYTYVLHLVIAVPMLIIEVPFSKWAHLCYRPVAMYLNTIKQKALELQIREKADIHLIGAEAIAE